MRSYDEDSERVSRALLAATRQGHPALDRVDGVYLAHNGNLFAVQGSSCDPASRRVFVNTQQAVQTEVAQSDAALAQAARDRTLEQHASLEREVLQRAPMIMG